MNIYNYAKNKGLRLYHRPLFNRVTDDNKGVKSFHSKPYSFPIQSGFIPLVAGSLKLQIAFLVYCFIACKSMKFSETSYRISKKFHYLPVYFFIFHNKEALLFRAKPLLRSKIVASSTKLSMSPQF